MENYRFREIDSQLKQDGWYPIAAVGGHIQYLHKTKKGKVTVPTSKGDISGKLLRSIEKQAQLKFHK